tara:strand:+ start:964 stop:1143 length:180 start_codon:yes stop_codon:yes gene_type:complete
MQEDKKIYESPDGGKTVFERPLRVPNELTDDEKKEAYKVLAYYESNVILYAARILKNTL